METNGVAQTNGKHSNDMEMTIQTAKRPRADEPDARDAKKTKIAAQSSDDDLIVVVEDESNGAIVIDD